MKEIKRKTEYNYLNTMGWTVIFRNNRVVNYHADCGELDDRYYFEDKVFAVMVEEMRDVLQITEVIELYNEHKQNVWDTHKITMD